MKFEWDPQKVAFSLQNHGVSFEEAASVFGDSLAATIPDPEHSTDEARFITMGVSRSDPHHQRSPPNASRKEEV